MQGIWNTGGETLALGGYLGNPTSTSDIGTFFYPYDANTVSDTVTDTGTDADYIEY